MNPQDVLAGRECPLTEDGKAILRRELEALRDWVGPDWLERPESHPLRAVWKRRDAQALLELQAVGTALHRLGPVVGRGVQSEWLSRVRGSDDGDMRGAIFEVLTAGMFHGPGREVRAGTRHQRGYDYEVVFTAGGTLRVSCKSREVSIEEKKATAFAKSLRAAIVEQIPPLAPVTIHLTALEGWHESIFDVDETMAAVRHAVRAARSFSKAPLPKPTKWVLRVAPLDAVDPRLVFVEGKLSFSLMVWVPFQPHLVADRFRQSVENALANIQRFCDVGDDRANVLFYRIPPMLALEDARQAVRDALAATTSTRTSSVFLFRASMATTHRQRESFYLGQELHDVTNDAAEVPASRVIPGGKVALTVLAGKPQSVEPVMMLTDGHEHMPIRETCVRLHGEHFYRAPDWSDLGVRIIGRHGLAMYFTGPHPAMLDMVTRRLTEEMPPELQLI